MNSLQQEQMKERIKELERNYIKQQIMYQKWFDEVRKELKELRKYAQEDGVEIDKLKAKRK